MAFNNRSQKIHSYYSNAPKLLYLGSVLRTLGYNLMGGFGMIYIFNLFLDTGFSEKQAFVLLLGRVALLYLVKLFLIFPTAGLVKRVGAKALIVIGSGLSALSMVTWALAAENLWWLLIDIVLQAVLVNVYWVPFHSLFSDKNDESTMGKQMGILTIIGSLISIITPVVAGIVIEYFGGFNVLFAFSFLVFSMAAIAFSQMDAKLDVSCFDWKDLGKAFHKEKRLVPDYVVIGAEDLVQYTVWSVFVFLFIQSFLKLGILTSVISLALAIFSYFIGKMSDERKVGGIDRFGAMFNGVIWIGKLFVENGLHVFFLDSLFGLFRTSYLVPIDVIVYSNAKHDNPMWPVIVREIALDIGRVFMGVIAAVLIFLNLNYWSIFLVAAIGYILLGLLLKDNIVKRK